MGAQLGTRSKLIHRVEFFAGQSSGFNSEAIDLRKSKLLYNFYIQNGMARKIPGSSLYLNSAEGSSPVRWMGNFNRRLMFQLGGKLLIETAEGSQVESLLSSDLATDRIFADTWRDRIYLANGTDLRFYDGTNLSDLGLLPPGLGKTPRHIFTGRGVGSGSLASGDYKYMIAFYDETTETESLPMGSLPDERGLFNSAEFDTDDNPLGWLTTLDIPVTLGNIVLSVSSEFVNYIQNDLPNRVSHIRLYRAFKASGGTYGDFSLVTSFAKASGTFTDFYDGYSDGVAQGSLGEIIISEDLVPPPTREATINAGAAGAVVGPKFSRFWRDSLFLFGTEFPEYTVTDSLKSISNKNFASDSILYGSDTFLPEYYPFNWEIGRGDNQKPTGLAVVNDTLVIFKERSIYTLVGTSLSNFVPKIQDETRGCIASGSIQETPFGVLFLSSAGVARFKGGGDSEIISAEIFDEIQDINREALDVIASSYDSDEEVYTLFVPQGTGTENNRELKISLKDNAWSVGRRRRDISAATIIPKSDGPQKSLLATASGGNILDISSRATVSDWNNLEIRAIWRSGDIDFGDREAKKRLVWLYIKAQCGLNFVIDINIYGDDGQKLLYSLTDVDSDSYNALYASSSTDADGAVYGVDRYAGDQTPNKIKVPVSGIARDFYIEIVEKQNNTRRHSFDLMSVELEAVRLTR